MDFNYLTTIIFLPAVGAILIAFLPGLSEKLIKRLAALFTFIPLALSIYLFAISITRGRLRPSTPRW